MVVLLRVERERKRYAQRPEGRSPGEPHACRVAQGRQGNLLALAVNLPAVYECGQAQRRVLAGARYGKQEFRAAIDFPVAAQRVAVDIPGAEGVRAVAAHRV